jgi:FHA domain-containing protein
MIKNVGSANPITVRGQSLSQGESAPLRHGDQLRIGGYLLEASDDGTVPGEGATVLRRGPVTPVRAVPAPSPLGASPLAAGELGAPLSSDNPFASLLGPAPAPGGRAAGTASRLPDDFDPFAPPQPSVPPAPSTPEAGIGGVFADLIPGGSGPSIDEMFGLQGRGAPDPLAGFMAQAPGRQGASPAPALPTDPLALFGGGADDSTAPAPLPPAAPEAGALRDDTPELRAAFRPPQIRPVPPAVPVPMPVPEPSPRPAPMAEDTAALWAAFCEGARIRLEPPQGLNPELMRVIGNLLRTAVEGSLQLMAVRAATKHELRAEVTVIQSRNNNPLKFSPDAQAALEQLLQPPLRGFLAGPAAMSDAMHDLIGHAIGTMAGTRAALEGVLRRFAPGELEGKLSAKSMLDSVLPINRKAKLWELYLQHFEAIRDEAQDDFHTLFGKAFLAAYEQQLERLEREKNAA